MEIISRVIELAKWLEWALDLIDLYDKRLSIIDGPEAVYTEAHIKAKEQARKVLEDYTGHKGA